MRDSNVRRMSYWRVTSWTVENIRVALNAGVWGEERPTALAHLRESDRLVFYSTDSRKKGFWATGTVMGPMYVAHDPVWHTGFYPFRIPLRVDVGPAQKPIQPKAVFEILGVTRLSHSAPRKAIIPLTAKEFQTIEALIRQGPQKANA